MIVGSRKKISIENSTKNDIGSESKSIEDTILEYVDSRDYLGAATYIDFLNEEMNQQISKEIFLWKGYCLFHAGQYNSAIDVYQKLLQDDPSDITLYLYIASCYYYLGDYEQSRDYAKRGSICDLQTRLIFHLAQQRNDEEELYQAHGKLVGTLENQLSLAAIHYMRCDFQEAIDLYNRLLTQSPDYIALNVYIAMCEFRLDQFQESNDHVDLYLNENSDSAVSLNLKACDYFRLFDPEIAESQLLQIQKFSSASYEFADTLVKHNLCVFHNGENGFSILPRLVSVIPEARYNLGILYMRQNNPRETLNLIQDHRSTEVNELILRAGALLACGQKDQDADQISEASQIFSDTGKMEVVCNTVPGREALASADFIQGEYDGALNVLGTIQEFIGETDEFNYNKGMTLAMLNRWNEAEQYFLQVKNESILSEPSYKQCLCRCYINNKKSDLAWEIYVNCTSIDESKILLTIIASDCFTLGDYYYAMRAYDILTKYEVEANYKKGMIASAVGVFRAVLTQKESPSKLTDVIGILSAEPSAAQILSTIQQYVAETGTSDEETVY